MPIYEYRCAECRHHLEALQKFSDAPLTTCPKCGKEALRKQVSAAGFQLKGSGWYQTDFRGSGGKPPAKSDGEGAGKAGAEGAKSGESAGSAEKAAPAAAKSEPATGTASTASGPPAAA